MNYHIERFKTEFGIGKDTPGGILLTDKDMEDFFDKLRGLLEAEHDAVYEYGYSDGKSWYTLQCQDQTGG